MHNQPLLVEVHEVAFEGIQETMYCVKYCYGLYAHSLLGGPGGMHAPSENVDLRVTT